MNLFDIVGLSFSSEDEAVNFIYGASGRAIEEGKEIEGYYDTHNFFLSVGDPEFYVPTIFESENKINPQDFKVHVSGQVPWKVNVKADLTHPDEKKYFRRILVSNEDDKGAAVINVINSDVLPSYCSDDALSFQVVGFVHEVDYFADEEEYAAAVDEDGDEKKTLLGPGTFFPLALISDKDLIDDEDEKEYRKGLCLVRGTVKSFRPGTFKFGDDTVNTFIYINVETEFGILQLVQTDSMFKDEQRYNLHEGATVVALVELSGDAAIYEHNDGIVKDEENDLSLFKASMSVDDPERLRKIIKPTTKYHSCFSEQEFTGADEIINKINYVRENGLKYYIYRAVIEDITSNEKALRYGIGKKCLVMATETPDNLESILFLDIDDVGMVDNIVISNDSQYRFKILKQY